MKSLRDYLIPAIICTAGTAFVVSGSWFTGFPSYDKPSNIQGIRQVTVRPTHFSTPMGYIEHTGNRISVETDNGDMVEFHDGNKNYVVDPGERITNAQALPLRTSIESILREVTGD